MERTDFSSKTTFGDDARDELRVMVASVETLMVDASPALQAGWRALVTGLALGPIHQVRSCPHCSAVGMASATRCARCWNSLTPIAQRV